MLVLCECAMRKSKAFLLFFSVSDLLSAMSFETSARSAPCTKLSAHATTGPYQGPLHASSIQIFRFIDILYDYTKSRMKRKFSCLSLFYNEYCLHNFFFMLTSHTTGSGKDAITVISHRDFPSFSVQVAHYGATLLSFHTSKEFGDIEILGGYRSLEDLHVGYASRNWVMAPFANRIPNGRYTWQGSEYMLPEGSRMHGLVAKEVWDLLDVSTTEDAMELTFTLDSLSDGIEGYPFELLYTLTYTVSLEGVAMEITATNAGESDAPYFVGWHTYFTL